MRLNVVLARDHGHTGFKGPRECQFVQNTAVPAPVLGGSDDNTINVQKTLVALDEPPIVDAVVACALSKRQNEGNDISLDLENLVKVRRLVKPAEALPGERAEEPLRFQV